MKQRNEQGEGGGPHFSLGCDRRHLNLSWVKESTSRRCFSLEYVSTFSRQFGLGSTCLIVVKDETQFALKIL